ncbi:sensor histidine kinase [Actinokineospora inagensis]|uniref:sensor histidine kinase n=1 Tax=Actinokineospora inagensis TaxID=103730 RepID=UPI000412D133|nr:histidine kinase [Actinokineospora inagensis]
MLGERVYAWARAHASVVDVGGALALAGVGMANWAVVRAPVGFVVWSVLLALPLVVRRRWVVGCAAAVLVVAIGQWVVVGDSLGVVPGDLAVPVVVHACAAYGPRWSGRAALVAGLVGAGLGGVRWPMLPTSTWAHVVTAGFLACSVVAAWAVGSLHRARLGQVAVLVDRARLLEVEREQRDRLAVLAERTRIAREMHDVVAHSLAVVIAQADGGRYSGEPVAALVTIAEHGRQALVETRRLLGLLRAEDPGIDDVPGLVERVRTGGLDVALHARPVSLAPELGLVVYRIVQEGLTNVIKHVGPTATAVVSVRKVDGHLEVDVRDNGTGAVDPTGGYGVIGMRERAAAFGGTVTLRPAPGGGTVLSARIPA